MTEHRHITPHYASWHTFFRNFRVPVKKADFSSCFGGYIDAPHTMERTFSKSNESVLCYVKSVAGALGPPAGAMHHGHGHGRAWAWAWAWAWACVCAYACAWAWACAFACACACACACARARACACACARACLLYTSAAADE